ncbi:deoxyribodipyrimidine photo-lyase [Vibrio parahaemolyticus]|uniref:Deoxyribodipyrimidine photo-lyase n=1 Tax=Vibrio parahaemolyticus TaxID=670 RepID=A0A9Q3YIJ1_VIBPH|nr:deoxyribodipyrimidine photo-lyase [Vibrio parahaemolyticus]EGQ7796889.1 deoxyribodipyrimidine photo-lyase [Vibrio parahaemolyticus]EGQ8101463.1 deoxyribodipyrimidine photo-lyase [Vibrio parahaemolyticus]EGQ8111836.1 deoxyribodipyrimidine photo-lyase [Vibrio parahaemolyticus]EGQ8200520.1 deoxyribodipyrimidine photo-lyase [Vibrio parahaemolyticus]EGQ8548133.1 deoxyribodipyrimidine photo-lyase [Vibrio parahaemolyticus]
MILVWFRRDLRTLDHTALKAALDTGQPVVACFVATPEQWQEHHMAPMQADLIARRLEHVHQELTELNIPLLYREVPRFDDCTKVICDWADKLNATAAMVNINYEVNEVELDRKVSQALDNRGVEFHAFHDKCVHAPTTVLNKQGEYFKVFTPFKRAWLQKFSLPTVSKPQRQNELPSEQLEAVKQDGFDADYTFSYPRESSEAWCASTNDILKQLRTFARERSDGYQMKRDFPAIDGTSQLSPYLAIGALSPRQCIARLYAENPQPDLSEGKAMWLSEIIWREFYQHLLVFEPKLVKGRGFIDWEDKIQWSYDEQAFECWKTGTTGYPIVDAAMRQLNQTGWMHNRLRMIVASFLTKDLHIDWRWGEEYFMSKLVDGDFAANNGGWQWSASTGCDGQPYFRIFNPISQGEKFDSDGQFVRHWVPEIKSVPNKFVHKPWTWEGFSLLEYHKPMVDHKVEREITLRLFKSAKE